MDKIEKSVDLESFCNSLDRIGLSSIGVAVSGGSDSMALFYLSYFWGQRTGNLIKVASIDHGLRKNSAYEIQFVKERVRKNHVSHCSLKSKVDINNLQGNIQDNARTVRYKLLTEWAKKEGLQCVLLGHTLDDQEENLILRFFRGSGVDGLASMEKKKLYNNILWFRPLLEYRKISLQIFLKDMEKDWVEDPSNNNEKFERIKIRKLLPKLKEAGLIKKRFVQTADHMKRATEVLAKVAINEAKGMIEISDFGETKIDVYKYAKTLKDTQFRILSGLISWYSGNFYRPRFNQLDHLQKLIAENNDLNGVSLGGIILKKSAEFISINREMSAIKIKEKITCRKIIWDNRWRLSFGKAYNQKLKIVPLGSLNYKKKEIFDIEVSTKTVLDTLPAILYENQLVFTPFSKLAYDIEVELLRGEKHLYKNF